MTSKEFLRRLANGDADILQILLDLLAEAKAPYCVIGGLAVNAYVEPVVSLDLDIIVVADQVKAVCDRATGLGLKVETFPHSVNLGRAGSDLRIQLQTDERYQSFLGRSVEKSVLGYPMRVAVLEDLLQGKIWAYTDKTRRKSKRQKDLADIFRLVESYPELRDKLPTALKKLI